MKTRIYAALAIGALTSSVAFAGHAWSTYHWARTTSSFDLTVVNSTTADWDPYVAQALGDWSASSVLNMVEVAGDTQSKTRRRCSAPSGQVRICNLAYGNTGWLGIAGISLDSSGHIVSGYTKLNDTYYSSGSYYDAPEWRQSVTCQELGHNLGLDHQDENFNNESLYSCMDYQDPPFEYPNAHDFEQLEIMYGHVDSYDSYSTAGGGGGGGGGGNGCNAPPGKGCNKLDPDWGQSMSWRGNTERFVRHGSEGMTYVTFVTWADEE